MYIFVYDTGQRLTTATITDMKHQKNQPIRLKFNLDIDPTIKLSRQPVCYFMERPREASGVRVHLTVGHQQGQDVTHNW